MRHLLVFFALLLVCVGLCCFLGLPAFPLLGFTFAGCLPLGLFNSHDEPGGDRDDSEESSDTKEEDEDDEEEADRADSEDSEDFEEE